MDAGRRCFAPLTDASTDALRRNRRRTSTTARAEANHGLGGSS